MGIDFDKIQRGLRSLDLDRAWNDPDFEIVKRFTPDLKKAFAAGYRLADVYALLRGGGFGGNMNKLSLMLEKQGLRKRKRGRISRKWEGASSVMEECAPDEEHRAEKPAGAGKTVQREKARVKRKVWASGTRVFGAPIKTDHPPEPMETGKSGDPIADILAVYDDVAEGEIASK